MLLPKKKTRFLDFDVHGIMGVIVSVFFYWMQKSAALALLLLALVSTLQKIGNILIYN